MEKVYKVRCIRYGSKKKFIKTFNSMEEIVRLIVCNNHSPRMYGVVSPIDLREDLGNKDYHTFCIKLNSYYKSDKDNRESTNAKWIRGFHRDSPKRKNR